MCVYYCRYKIPYDRFSSETLLKAEQYRQKLLSEAVAKAKRLVADNQAALHAIAATLLREEIIEGEDLREIIRSHSGDQFRRSAEQKHAHFL